MRSKGSRSSGLIKLFEIGLGTLHLVKAAYILHIGEKANFDNPQPMNNVPRHNEGSGCDVVDIPLAPIKLAAMRALN